MTKQSVRRMLLLLTSITGLLLSRPHLAGEGFSMPTDAPFYPAPPYQYRDGWSFTIPFRTNAQVLRKLVPEPLTPNKDSIMVLSLHRWKITTPFTLEYHEAILSAPVTFQEKAGTYMVYLYLDDAVAIVAGREIWGFPKKNAVIKLVEQQGTLQATVERGGVTLVRASMPLGKLVRENSEQPDSDYFNLKLIPSANKGGPPDVMQLTSARGVDQKLKAMCTGKAAVTLSGTTTDPLQHIPMLEVLEASYSQSDFVLTYGEILHDYLKQRATVTATTPSSK